MKSLLLASLVVIAAGTGPARAEEAAPSALEKARAFRLWTEPEWRRLLHFAPGPLGTRSEVVSPAFFLSARGRRDPRAELEADLAGFLSAAGQAPDEHPQCRFPARYAWLKSRLGPFSADVECPRFLRWKEELKADSVTLIFASAYLDNPSSMYGHTFLRLDHPGASGPNPLLDYAVNFAAVPTTNNGILFAVDGLFGVFPGRYSVMPYYLKVQEYSDLESRDLWEYRLNLDAAAIERLTAHLWELGPVDFPYYFFNKNCSYQLLPFLETARPDLRLARGWPLYVIPADTVKTIAGKGLVAEREFRPSLTTTMLARRSTLSAPEVRLAGDLARGEEPAWPRLESLPPARQASVLDSALEYLQYRVDYRPERASAAAGLDQRLLLARSRLALASPPLSLVPPPPPESGHGSTTLSLDYGYEGQRFLEASWRPGLHDLLDPPAGYSPDSELSMFSVRIRHDLTDHETYLRELSVVRILSLSPVDPWIHKPSWLLDFGWRTADEFEGNPGTSGYFGATGGSGLSVESHVIGTERAYALIEADGGAGQVFHQDFRLGAGPAAGLAVDWRARFRTQFEARDLGYAVGDRRPVARLRLENAADIGSNLSLRLVLQDEGRSREIDGGLVGYF